MTLTNNFQIMRAVLEILTGRELGDGRQPYIPCPDCGASRGGCLYPTGRYKCHNPRCPMDFRTAFEMMRHLRGMDHDAVIAMLEGEGYHFPVRAATAASRKVEPMTPDTSDIESFNTIDAWAVD